MTTRITDWQPIKVDGEPSARVQCPECRQWATLDHVIAPDGRVAPSVDCPTDGCSFHDMIELAGWQRRQVRAVVVKGQRPEDLDA